MQKNHRLLLINYPAQPFIRYWFKRNYLQSGFANFCSIYSNGRQCKSKNSKPQCKFCYFWRKKIVFVLVTLQFAAIPRVFRPSLRTFMNSIDIFIEKCHFNATTNSTRLSYVYTYIEIWQHPENLSRCYFLYMHEPFSCSTEHCIHEHICAHIQWYVKHFY